MIQTINKPFHDCSSELIQMALPELIQTALADGKINALKMDAIINRKAMMNQLSFHLNHKNIKVLCDAVVSQINATARQNGLYCMGDQRECAVISGAGIAGLAASFELITRGFKVVIAEKRNAFSRFNCINFDVEAQRFLEKFGLLKEFEDRVAARLNRHRCVHIGKKGTKDLGTSYVSHLKIGKESFEPENYDKLFNDEGIYSVKIGDLQDFLAKKALEAGVRIFGEAEAEVLPPKRAGKTSKLQIMVNRNPMILRPQLFFIAEGAHSATAKKLGMEKKEVINECTGENWIFGNMDYSGKENFVVSLIDTSEGSLEIANVIFNAKLKKINIAVTSKKVLSKELIEDRILQIAKRVLPLENINEIPLSLIKTEYVDKPVHIKNEMLEIFSKEDTYPIGDAAGHSSPLAGLGGTLGLTLILRTIQQLLDDRERLPHKMHDNFERFSKASVLRWFKKSRDVKTFCLKIFNDEQIPSKDIELKEENKDES